MSDLLYDLEVGRVVKEAKSRGVKTVLVQAPDGLKPYIKDLCQALSSIGATIFVSADPCFGGCYLADGFGELLGAEMSVHVGHKKFVKIEEKVPTLYIPARSLICIDDLIGKSAEFLRDRGFKKVGLVASLQHLNNLRDFADGLRSVGLDVLIDELSGGLVLGCVVEGATRIAGAVDAILHVGGGDFHALGVALAVDKPVYIADPYRGEVRDLERLKRKVLAKRWWAIEEAKKAKTLGVVVIGKGGQFKKEVALRLKERLEGAGRQVFMVIADDASWERLSSFTFIEAFIITGCPRISLDNYEVFARPVLNEEDAMELLRVIRG
ncbi:MAG: diphthamide biosynthesis enzyme Dph2 [Candidatus Methanomethylicaceae archaeon]